MRHRWSLLALLTLAAAACAPAGATAPAAGEPSGAPSTDAAETGEVLPTVPDDTAPTTTEQPAPASIGIPDIAAIHRDGTITRVADGVATSVPRHDGAAELLAFDGATLIRTTAVGDSTSVEWIRVLTGEVVAQAEVDGTGFVPAATDPRALAVALVNPGEKVRDGAIAPGRSTSTIVMLDRANGERSRVELDGNFQPEAIGGAFEPAAGPPAVFVLEYLPADAPTHYRVRVLWTDGGLGLPVSLRDKVTPVDAAMAGISRTQVVSGYQEDLLFTLYRGVAGEDGRHGYAFVHTLGFANGVWCLDIPHEMELDVENGALAAAGNRLVVASANGTVGSYDIGAVLNPERSPAMDVLEQYLHPDADPVVAATHDRAWVAWGTFVYELDPATMSMTGDAPHQTLAPVTALAATRDGTLVMAHAGGEVSTLDGSRMQLRADAADAGDGADVLRIVTV